MRVVRTGPWVYYSNDNISLERSKLGKWMCFFTNRSYVENICQKAIATKAIQRVKHTDAEKGVACFYLNEDDIEAHKRVLQFFIQNDLIQRSKNGRLHNISFKLDSQTRAGDYGDDFKGELKLDSFIDLNTSKWLV